MKKYPYNACDYRCERCLETAACAVFRMTSEREARNRAMGRETEGLEAAIRDVGEIFEETKEMLLQEADEFDFDLDAAADTEHRDTFEEAREDDLFLRAREFTMKVQEFLKKIEPVITPDSQEFFDDIAWHHAIVSAKVFRAIGSENEPEIRFDAVNSAAVAVKSLTICIMAFEALASRYPETGEDSRKFATAALGIKQSIRERFRE